MKNLKLTILCLLFIGTTMAQETTTNTSSAKKKYFTQRISDKSPEIDGKLDDDAWNQVDWGGDYIQRTPNENAPPTQKTAFKILYDDKFYT